MGRLDLRSLWVLLLVCAAGCFFDHAGFEGNGGNPDGAADGPAVDAGPDGQPADARVDGAVDASSDAAIDAMPDACVPLAMELCNGRDDTCEGTIDEGLGLGTPCDGPDTDLCADDMRVCDPAGTGTICGDTSGDDDAEICNGGDDDCDLLIDEGFVLGVPCDGPDGDMCNEGTSMCDGFGGLGCSDATGTTVETCNFIDDDCDGAIDTDADVSSDEANCGACFNACTNPNGTTECIGGVCTPTCVGANDCDSDPDDGCELLRDTDPTCPGTPGGTVRGDFMSDTISYTGSTEAWYQFTVSEVVSGPINPTANITLVNPPGVDFDLYVMCDGCFAATVYSSTNAPGVTEVLHVEKTDISGMGTNETFDIRVEVRYAGATACGDWTLTIIGNVGSTVPTCF